MSVCVVNATALDSSGALTILKQFVENIPQNSMEYIVFISPVVELVSEKKNIRIVPVKSVKGWVNRFFWDAYGVRKWLNKRGIVPNISLSLQNTNFRTGYKIPNYIYYHQPLPFYSHSWSFFKSQERTMWFYKNIYPFFVRLFLNDCTKFFVQLNFVKEGVIQKYGIAANKIHVLLPKIVLPTINNCRQASMVNHISINLFYPATSFFYKNHKLLIDAVNSLKNENIKLYLTCDKNELDCTESESVRFIGKLSYDDVIYMYKHCDAVVFPSYIETLGLPLIEAASTGCPILAADLPYAREVLADYSGVTFLPYNDVAKWSEAIMQLKKGARYDPLDWKNKETWNELFEIMNNK